MVQELNDDWLKIAWCQLNYVKFSHQVTAALGLFKYKMHNFTPITFHLANKWSKSVVS